jgi:tetratricopeptide (TPR) repeat protein
VSAIRDNFGYHITIPAGACYDRSLPSSSDYTYSYNYVHLDFDSDKGIVFFRKWSELNRNWKKDDETAPPNGERDFSISGSNKPPIPHQIPPPPRDFKGREQDISDILYCFEKGAAITGVRGMGGVGKTAFALKLAEKIKDNFPDGQIFIDMRGTSTNPNLPALKPEEAMAHVIRAYSPTDRLLDNINGLRGLYHTILTERRILLLLDNASDATQVQSLLPPANCFVIITSRLKFTLPGLAEKDLDILPAEVAQQLLLDIAPRIGSRSDELAKLCGYLPLALRNAASALAEKKDLKVSDYEQRLKDKVARLELVKGSFSLSYDLLSPGRRKQWSRLSVFPNDFDRDAAIAVLKMAPGASSEALSDLVHWSLVDYIPKAGSDDGRYKLHDLARLFAESCLEGVELVDAKQKHANYYSKILSYAGTLYTKGGMDLLEGLEIFDQELANIKVGYVWAKSAIQSFRMLNKRDSKSIIQLAGSYAKEGIYILDLRLHPRDQIAWLETGLAAARILQDRQTEGKHLCNLGNAYSHLGEIRKAIEFYEQALNISRDIGDHKAEEADLGNLGVAYSHLGEPRRAIGFYEQAFKISREIRDLRGEGAALGNLGLAYSDLGEPLKAIEFYDQALKIAQEIGDRRNEGVWLGCLGLASSYLGETRKSIEFFNQALKIAKEIGNRRSEGVWLGSLGLAYYHLGEIRRAIELYGQAISIAQEIGDRSNEGIWLGNLGLAYYHRSEIRKAMEFYDRALGFSKEIGNRRGEAAWLGNLGLASSDLGEIQKAIEFYEEALKISREIGDRKVEGNQLSNMGLAHSYLGEPLKAIEFHKQSLVIMREIGDKQNESEILCNLGKAYLDLKETDKIIDYCAKSLDIARNIEYRKFEGEALCTLSKTFVAQGEPQKALDHCDKALKIFQDIESPKGEAEALFAKSQALHQLAQHKEAVSCAQQALAIFQRIESPLAEKVRQQLAEWGGP